MAYRCRSLSQPTFSVFKSAFTKPTVKPKSAPSFRTVTARSPLTTPGQAPLKPFSPHFCLFFNSSNFDRWCLKILNSGRFLKWVFVKISNNFNIVAKFWNFRSVPQLGALQSLLPLHSAVSSARLTSCLGLDSTSSRSLSQGMLCSANPGVWFSPLF